MTQEQLKAKCFDISQQIQYLQQEYQKTLKELAELMNKEAKNIPSPKK